MRKVLRFSGLLALYCLSTIAFGQVLINEDFATATGTTPPAGWANIDSSASGEVWEFNNPGSRTLNSPISDPAAIFDSDNYGSGGTAEDTYLESPSFDASTASGSIFLTFDHYFRGGAGGSYEVLVYNGSTWSIVASGSSSTADPVSESIDITTAAGASAVAQVRFRWQGNWSWYWILDNVKVEELSCLDPTALGATNITAASADVYWTTGGAMNWNIEYGTAGFTPGTGTTIIASNDTTNIGSLAANTTYEFYVQDSCGAGNVSGFSGPFQFTTLCASGLSGAYTINSAMATGGTNFSSFSDAASELNACGVSGAVTFTISAGTYNESLVLNDISGASTTNTITFDGVDTATTSITHSSTSDEPTIYFNGADHVTIQNLTVSNTSTSDAWGIMFQNSSDSNTITNCQVIMPVGTTTDVIGIVASNALSFETSTGDNANGLTISNNYISGGETGIHLTGGSARSSHNTGNTIQNNLIRNTDDHGIEVDGQSNLIISGNDIADLNNSSADAIYLQDVDDYTVSGNTVVSTDWGLYVLDGNDGHTPSANSMIMNNMIASTGGDGVYLNDFEYTTFIHNSVSGTPGLLIHDQDSLVIIKNNILYSTTGEAFESTDDLDGHEVIDYNLYYSGGSDLIELGTTFYTDLASWQAADANLNINAVEGDPIFTSATDLHVLGLPASDAGEPLSVATDIDGETRSLTTPDIGADEYTPATCFPPSSLGAANVGATSADLYWTSGGASDFRVEYGTSGFALGSGTNVAAFNDTLSLSSLSANTSYDFYVKDSCSTTVTSIWSPVASFTTLPTAVATPYTNDIESGAGDFALSNGADADVRVDTIVCSGANALYFTGGSSSGWSGTSTSTTATQAWSTNTTKQSEALLNVDATGVTGSFLTLEFDLKQQYSYGLSYCWFRVLVDGVQISPDYNPTTQNADPCSRISLDLSAYVGTSFALTFQHAGKYDNARGSSGNGDNSIVDNISIFAPSCNAPSALTLVSATDTSATVAWTGGGAANWNVQYGAAGFTLGAGTVVAATNDTITINGLMDNTSYDFYVQDSCGAGNVSAYTGPLNASTLCSVIPLPYVETFEVASSTTLSCLSAQANWAIAAAGGYGTSTNSLTFPFYNVNGGTFSAFSPEFAPTPTGYQLSLDHAKSAYTTEADSIEIYYSMDGGVTYTLLVGLDGSATGALTTAGANTGAFTPTSTDWSTFSIALPVGVNRLRVDAISAFGNNLYIDNLSVDAAPNCPAPSALSVVSTTDSSVTLTWTGGGAANWNVQYGAAGFTLGAGTVMAATNDTITINGLTDNTSYDFYVQDSCGAGNVSAYVGPLNASTLCLVLPLPYVETFEVASSTTLSCLSAQANWAIAAAGGYGTSTNSLTFPFYNVNGGTFSAFSPEFAPTPTGYQLSLDHAKSAYTTEADSIEIYYSMDGGVTYTLLVGLDGSATGALTTAGANTGAFTPTSTDWSTFSIALPVGVNRLRVDAISAFGNNLYIDNLSVDAAPNCTPPSGFGVDTATQTTATIYWTDNANSIGTYIEYGLTGFTLGTGAVTGANNDTTTILNLQASTCYDFYLLDTCAPGLVSSIVGPFTVCTACDTLTTPFFEGFETLGTTIPNCWSSFSTTGELWRFRNTNLGHSASTGANGSAHFAAFDDSETPVTTDGILETPFIDVSALNAPALSFYMWSDAEDGSGVSAGFALNASISIDVYDGAAWNTLFTRSGNTDGWEQFYVDLTGLTITGPIQIRFIVDEDHGGGFDDDISLDDISLVERPACFDPTDLTVLSTGLNDVDLSWTSDTTVNTSIVEYGVQGFILGSGTQVPGSGGTANVPGLTSATCYDFYVLDSCSGGFTSWLGPITACTQAPCIVSTTPTGTNDSTGCGGGYVAVSAVSGNGGTPAWVVNGNVVAISDTLGDTIAATTTYEAYDFDATGVGIHVGPTPDIATAGFGNFTNGQFISVLDTIYIDSTTVRANGFVNAQVIIRDAAGVDIIQRGTVFETDTAVTANYQVPVDILLTPGNYFIGIDFDVTAVSLGALFRATSGAVYPYTIPGMFEITGVNFAGPRYYYTFDMVIRGACIGNATPVLGHVPGASAGLDVTTNVCESESAVDLSGLVGPNTPGGTWFDLSGTGALTGGIFDATITGPGGPFNFRYVVSGAGGCPADTALVTLTVDTLNPAGSSASVSFCTDNNSFITLLPLLTGGVGGGTWADIDASGILLGNRIRPSNGTPGVYRFRYTTAASGVCGADSATVTVTLDDPVEGGDNANDTTCLNSGTTDLSTYLSTTATAGGTWVDVSGSGGLTGSTFNPSGVAANVTYEFRYLVTSATGGCSDSASVFLYVCDDVSNPEYKLDNIRLYPNPTTGVFFIEDVSADKEGFSIEVMGLDGKLIQTARFTTGEKQTIDISELPSGIYNVKVITNDGFKVFRVIAQD
jgi:hypothetical protein